ncbi:MAG: hypothetical protein ACREL4_07620 [Gemmatimonadales bacterium]
MVVADSSVLSGWESFYVIVGGSGGALVGLQFVVLTLIADRRGRASRDTLNAFGTPTVFHLSGALFISALMSVPWRSLGTASIALVLCGLAGLCYGVVVIRRAHRQSEYAADREDWMWYILIPAIVYGILTIAAFCLRPFPGTALLVIGGCALGLLLIGVRNAWDTVTYVVTGEHEAPPAAGG